MRPHERSRATVRTLLVLGMLPLASACAGTRVEPSDPRPAGAAVIPERRKDAAEPGLSPAERRAELERAPESFREPAAGRRSSAAAGDPSGFARPLEEDRRPAAPSTSKERRQEILRGLIRRLCGDRVEADRAYKELLQVPAHLVPDLIAEVENPTPTDFYTLQILVLQDVIVRPGGELGELYYFVHGMGRVEFDDIAAGPSSFRGDRATQVRLRSFEGFPVGAVIRAALLNRMKSKRYPPFGDENLQAWWRAYYDLWTAGRRGESR